MKKANPFIIFSLLFVSPISAFAAPEPPEKDYKVFELILQDYEGNPFRVFGTQEQIRGQVEKLAAEAISLSAAVALGDNCRIQACFKQIVDVSKGTTELVPLTEEEILRRELDVANRAIKVQSLVESAGSDYQVRADAIFAIPLNAGGTSRTIQGSLSQIAAEVARLRAEADSLKGGEDPCAIETCYKTIVDLHWGLAPATTTTIPLTAEDLAQRAIDRNRQAEQAEALAQAAEAGMSEGASPVYQVEVSTPNQSYGTSGTRSQLAEQVRQLQEQANAARSNAENLANNPIVERHLIVDLHWGLAPATETIIEREITGAERDSRIAEANQQAVNAQALADAAAAALAEIP